jgi:hypothetical protein
MLAMHLPLPALVLPWLAGANNLVVVAPVALIAYWWVVLRERLPDRVAGTERR